jgi:hypothetical protein
MATEANWTMGTTADIVHNYLDETNKETYSVQVGSKILYALKQELTASGWQVISSSARTSYDMNQLVANMTFDSGAGDKWDMSGKTNEFEIIYPSVATFKDDSGTRYHYLSSSSGASGRSWCLLKWVNGGETGAVTARYHLLLDYVSSTSKPLASGFDAGDLDNVFGSQIGIYIFPDYEDADSNPFSAPNQAIRPHHKQEIGIPYRNADAGKAEQLFKIDDSGQSAGGKINFIHGNDGVGFDYHSHVITYSGDGKEKFLIVLSKIADVLTLQTPLYNGTKYFLFWSNISQGTGSNFKKPFGSTLAVSSNLSATSLADTICDGRIDSATIFYYSTYNPSAPIKYLSSQLNTSIPAFVTTQTRSDNTTPKIACIFKTTEFSKITSDGTYVEWPLPLIDIIGNNSNYRYVGRMLDIKIGPLNGVMGLVAKPSGTSTYDRLLFNNLWLPYNSTSGFDG